MFRRLLSWQYLIVLAIFPQISQCGLGPESLILEDIVREEAGITLCNESLTVCISERKEVLP